MVARPGLVYELINVSWSGLFPVAVIMSGGGYPDDVFPKVRERPQLVAGYCQVQGATGQGSCGGQKLGLVPSSFGFTHA